MSRFHNWCITQFRETNVKDYIENGPGLLTRLSKLKFGIVCLEICPDTKRYHHHYYLEFSEKVSMKWIKEEMNDNTIHCEPRMGSQKQAIDYVQKDETKPYVEKMNTGIHWCFRRGEPKRQGNRSDLDTLVDAIEEGYTKKEMLQEFRGNALRHLGYISKAIDCYYGWDLQDSLIKKERWNQGTEDDRKNGNKVAIN